MKEKRMQYRKEIIDYFNRHHIDFHFHPSKHTDYFFIQSIKGMNNHTLKIRVSNHPPKQNSYEIPFLEFWHTRGGDVEKESISNTIGAYIAKYKEKQVLSVQRCRIAAIAVASKAIDESPPGFESQRLCQTRILEDWGVAELIDAPVSKTGYFSGFEPQHPRQ